MVQCEMCGAETATPKTIKVEGAELDVCDDCVDFGTEVRTTDASESSTKYSTSSSGGSGGAAGTGSTSGGGGSSGRSSGSRRDMFDEMDELASDYGDRIRSAREAAELSQAELGAEINEKASLIRKLERSDVLPSDEVQRKLERRLDISLSGEAGGDDDGDWNTNLADDGLTLGDKVERRDS
ncbi:MAG: multiprotein bridging factor aMBF1 [Halobacteriaceae archaeon]